MVDDIVSLQNDYLEYLAEHEQEYWGSLGGNSNTVRPKIFGTFPPTAMDISAVCRNIAFGNFDSSFTVGNIKF
jgi:hypothetical protein